MKRLSVIIVNYNVKHFLEQCLLSVKTALEGIEGEVWVVDNNSVDGSQQMLRERFPWVHLIESKENLGFSKGNNLAMRQAKGEYVLLLNPDTIVEEGTFRKCLEFMDAHPEAGALGVKMLDGEGRFLPESKRGLPTPWVAFYKIFGVARLFPRSKRFGRYHLGYLSKDADHEVEVLSGAFMFMRQATLDKIGLLDETFFMYGEDIDLSYRVILGGYKNYYFSGTQIIHYKGESTKKGSLNYVKVFYNAMIIFAKKHFSKGNANFYVLLIRLAIYLRAFLAVASRVAKRIAFPLLEAIMVFAATYGIKEYWEYIHKLQKDGMPYPVEFDYIAAPIYTLVFIAFLWVAGGYKRPFRVKPIQTAAFAGFIGIATMSYIFPDINYSRMIVGLSSVAMAIIALLNRNVINYRKTGHFFFTEESKKRILIVGIDDEAGRIGRMIRSELNYPAEIVGTVRVDDERNQMREDCIGTLAQLDEIVNIYMVDEIIFANKQLSTERILTIMSQLEHPSLRYKIVPPNADYLVGPSVIHASRHNQSSLYVLDQREARFRKRAFDVAGSGALLLLYPATFWVYRRPGRALTNLWNAFTGRKHLVGYIGPQRPDLPKLKEGVLNMLHRVRSSKPDSEEHSRGLDRHYAASYSPELDIEILLKGIRSIG
ncbi:MAG: glycosyltransferase [Bacteroidota bacterium]